MNSCRFYQEGRKDQGLTYLMVSDGSFVRTSKDSSLQHERHPYVVFT